MLRLVMTLAGYLTLIAGTLVAQGDQPAPVRKKLEAAKKTFATESEKIRKEVLDHLAKREEAARKDGNKKLVDQIKTERDAYEEKEELPKTAPTALKQRAGTALTALEGAYGTAIKEYTRAKQDTEAAAVEKELSALKQSGRLPAGPWAVDFPPGSYSVGYTGKVTAQTELRRDGTFTRIKGKTENTGSFTFREGRLVLESADFVEEWRAVGGKIQVEHWWPVETYPKGKPQSTGEAARAKK